MYFKKHCFLINLALLILMGWTHPAISNESEHLETCRIRRSANSDEELCKTEAKTSTGDKIALIVDSLNFHFRDMDTDETDYWIIDEMIPHIKTSLHTPLGDSEAVDRANKYVKYLDTNLDGVIDIYELRFSLHSIASGNEKLDNFDSDADFIYWMKSFVGESPQLYPFYLVKTFQLLDEDINGKLTWKEIRMAIKLAELYKSVQESLYKDETAREELVASIKINPQQKWLNVEECWGLLYKLGIDTDDIGIFYHWIMNYLGGDSERKSMADSTMKEFADVDLNSDGIITKGEMMAVLHNHRNNYYTTERINRRWARADRNKDGIITFNEYAALEHLKHPQRK